MKRLIPYVLSGVAIAGVAVAQPPPTPQSAPDIAPQTSSEDSGPTRLTITVAVADPEDLKVEQGDRALRCQPSPGGGKLHLHQASAPPYKASRLAYGLFWLP